MSAGAGAAPAPATQVSISIRPEVMKAVLESPEFNPEDPATIELYSCVKNATKYLKISPQIDSTRYPTVYLTSDIHSDFRKLVELLKNLNLIDTPIDPYNGDEIYSPELICNTRWIGGSGVMLVIIGDLVDGRRNFVLPETTRFNAPDDPKGVFELIQYCFIYNLLLRAMVEGSGIIYTIGNHELCTIITNNDYMYATYVTDEARAYFKSYENRRRALYPFIEFCPNFIVQFLYNNARELACVHGGLHAMIPGLGIQDLTVLAEQKQYEIFTNPNSLDTLATFFGAETDPFQTLNPLWVRTYSSVEGGVCDHIRKTPYPLIVVGHCPTNLFGSSGKRFQELKQLPAYSECSDGTDKVGHIGCVYLDCAHPAPRLAFVDTAMSKGQRFPVKQTIVNGRLINEPPDLDNKNYVIEVLRLRHDDSAPPLESRYYNVIERVRTDGRVIQMVPEVVEHPLSARTNGASARRRKQRSRRNRRSTRRRNRRNQI